MKKWGILLIVNFIISTTAFAGVQEKLEKVWNKVGGTLQNIITGDSPSYSLVHAFVDLDPKAVELFEFSVRATGRKNKVTDIITVGSKERVFFEATKASVIDLLGGFEKNNPKELFAMSSAPDDLYFSTRAGKILNAGATYHIYSELVAAAVKVPKAEVRLYLRTGVPARTLAAIKNQCQLIDGEVTSVQLWPLRVEEVAEYDPASKFSSYKIVGSVESVEAVLAALVELRVDLHIYLNKTFDNETLLRASVNGDQINCISEF